jgi:hypothetical protein
MASFLSLTSNDLWLLLMFFRPGNIIGFENPYLGWLIEDIEQAAYDSLNHLVGMGLVKIRNENSLEIDDLLHSMVQTIAHSNHTLIVQQGIPPVNPTQHYIHFAENRFVVHFKLANGSHQITAIQDQATLLEYLDIKGDEQEKPSNKPFTISEEFLFRAAGEYAKGEYLAGENVLKESNLNSSSIQQLHEALSNTQLNRSYVLIKNQGNRDIRQVSGFGLLQGENHFWILQPVNQLGKTIIHFVPATTNSVCKQIIEVLPN